MLTGNKGEWSEVYALFRMLSDKNLYPGDANLDRIEGLVLPIVRIIREELVGNYEYSYEEELVIISGNNEKFSIPISEFNHYATILLEVLQANPKGTFAIPEIENFIESFNCKSVKANSSTKSDIRIVIHDWRTGTEPQLGFSIKSRIGGASTLLNAGRTTNFIFEIEGISLSDKDIDEINSIESRSKIKDRIQMIFNKGGRLKFVETENQVFESNLTLIDSLLPLILSHLIMIFYTSKISTTAALVEAISNENPLNFNTSKAHPYYKYKLKRLLTDIALGMMPSEVWTGELDATGGNLIVREDGEINSYHIYDRNQFEDYLFLNTKFETASSTKHHFGKIYRRKQILCFNLNLQIRFMK